LAIRCESLPLGIRCWSFALAIRCECSRVVTMSEQKLRLLSNDATFEKTRKKPTPRELELHLAWESQHPDLYLCNSMHALRLLDQLERLTLQKVSQGQGR
jgi:hypothetical protein